MTSKSLFTLLYILCISCYHAPTNTIRYPDTSKNHNISDRKSTFLPVLGTIAGSLSCTAPRHPNHDAVGGSRGVG